MVRKRILVTGCTGFTGSHLCDLLVDKEEVYGTVRGRCRQTDFIDHIKHKLTLLECDLTDYNSVQATIEDCQPDIIFHLGAVTYVPTSWRAPQETMNTNVMGTLNLLEAVRKSKFNPVIHISGSSEEYGMVHSDEVPIKETNQLKPLSPYGVSKVAQDLLGYQYFKSYGMKIIRTRCFNIIGPRSGEKIVTANFAKQLSKGNTVRVGNLDAIRDFVDVRDVVSAYRVAVEKCKYGEVYNIATGRGWEIREILDMMIGITGREIKIEHDETRMRPSDVPILIGDSTKFRDKTGWFPTYDIVLSLDDIIKYWRDK